MTTEIGSLTVRSGADITIGGGSVSDAVSKKHTQNTDQYLDYGGANQVAVADAKDAVDKKHTAASDDNFHGLTAKTVPLAADEFGIYSIADAGYRVSTLQQMIDSLLANGWIAAGETWTYASGIKGTAFSRAYTNDPAAGSDIELEMADTSGFNVGDHVIVSSSAGAEKAIITVVHTNTHITVGTLGLNHTTTGPLITRPLNMDFTFTISGDKTGKYQPGMKIKYTQSATVQYASILAVSYSAGTGLTTMTIFCGTDYDLANAEISSPYYSVAAMPIGWPTDRSKWTILTTNADLRSQSSPTSDIWYCCNLTNGTSPIAIIVPPGDWDLEYRVFSIVAGGTADVNIFQTLSTACASESDSTWTLKLAGDSTSVSLPGSKRSTVHLTSKTAYYQIMKTSKAVNYIYQDGATTATLIRAVPAGV